MLQKRSDNCFQYPANLKTLDLATMVSLYRTRGEPYEARSGDIIACAHTRKLLKQSKRWFGLHYSQKSWDEMLTNNSEGYPLTEVELNVMGLFLTPPVNGMKRDFVEQNCGVIQQLAFLIINDLKQFGFLEEEDDIISVSNRGVKALDGIARRIYEKKYTEEMLAYYRDQGITPGEAKKSTKQIPLF